jgi:hypothetical protein
MEESQSLDENQSKVLCLSLCPCPCLDENQSKIQCQSKVQCQSLDRV